jgi:ABC-type polysaccharide/polyol phosphate transport system ATPase subunit
MEVAYGRIMDLCGIEVIVRVCTVVGEAMPKVERLFSKVVGYTEVGTFLGAEIKQLAERVLRELVFSTEYAKPCNTRKLVC